MALSHSRSILAFSCFALGFGFTQSAFSQWWPATGTDTTNEWGTGGWGSFVEIYIDQAPLEALTSRVYEECTSNNPKFCTPRPIFGVGNDSILGVAAPKLNGLGLGSDGNIPTDCSDPDPAMFNATIIGNSTTTPASIAVCIIKNDAGELLPNSAAYCEVDITINQVSVSGGDGACVYERVIDVGDPGAGVFDGGSSVTLLKDTPAGLDPPLNPSDVPNCDIDSGNCTLPIGLPNGAVCRNSKCLTNLFPGTDPFEVTGQIFLANEEKKIMAVRYCVGDVGGGPESIACKGGNKQVETAEAEVIIECSADHAPSSGTISGSGNNTHKINYLSDCFPELETADTSDAGTIEFETVVDGIVTKSGIRPANECQFGGAGPSLLTCFVSESDLAAGCGDRMNDGTGRIDEIRGRAMVDISDMDEPPQLVQLIATDDNSPDGFLCKNLPPPE